jgi:phage/plasmid primase-like uncharacterized protein
MAADAFHILAGTSPASRDHPYLRDREIEPFGLHQQTDGNENTLYIPLRNAVGEVRGLQIINEHGDNSFLMGMEKEGNFHLITGPDQDKADLYSILMPKCGFPARH